MSSRKYNTNDNDLIWESFRNRTNHKQDSEYSKLLENDLKYIEDFLIREGIWDKVKGVAGAAAGKVKDFAADKILKPLMHMLATAIKKDPASAEKLPELQQAAQGGGDIGAILQKNGDQSIMKKIEGQPGVADPGGAPAATPQAESYLYQFKMNSMICEALADQGIISESKSQIIQERYYSGAIDTLFNEANRPKECPWMPVVITESAPQQAASQVADLMKQGGRDRVLNALLANDMSGFREYLENKLGVDETKIDKIISRVQQGQRTPGGSPAEAEAPAAEAPAAEAPAAEAPAAEAPAGEIPSDYIGGGDYPTELPDPPEDETEAPAAEAPSGEDAEAQIQDLQGQLTDDDPDTPDEIAQLKAQIAQLTAQINGGQAPTAAGPGPGAPTVGGDGSSMPAAPVADDATPSGGTEPGAAPGADDAQAPGILGKVWNFVKANKGAIGGLAAMGIAAALISFGGPVIAVPATRYLTGALMGGVRGAIKGAKNTEGGFADKLKGAANQAGADSMKGGAIGAIAGAAGDAVGGVMGGAADTAAAGEVPSAAAEPYVEPEAGATSDYGGEPEDYSAGGAYDQETPEIGGTSGGFDPETGESNMDMSDEEAAAFNATDANGETPGVDYQEPTATSAAEAEAGVGTIDPVTGKEIEAIDPENKPNWRDKLKSLMPGGTKPREVFGKYTGRG